MWRQRGGGPEAAKIFSRTSASAFENRSRKILAVACEPDDITAALNIHAIKSAQPGRAQRGSFSLSGAYLPGTRMRRVGRPVLLQEGMGPSRLPGAGRHLGVHTLVLPGKFLAPCAGAALRSGGIPAEGAPLGVG